MKKRFSWSDVGIPLSSIPYTFVGLYWFEHGFNWLVAILLVVLVIIPAAAVAWWRS